MPTPAIDSCKVSVTVLRLSPDPGSQDLVFVPPREPTRHCALLEVTIGSMRVDGVAWFDEAPSGALRLVNCTGPCWPDPRSLPAQVREVLVDLNSQAVTFRVCNAIEEAVQQYDREAGAPGDGPEAVSPVDFFLKFGIGAANKLRAIPGTREWDMEQRRLAEILHNFQHADVDAPDTCPHCGELLDSLPEDEPLTDPKAPTYPATPPAPAAPVGPIEVRPIVLQGPETL